MPARIVLTTEQKDLIRLDFEKDISIRDICKKYKISVMSMRPILKDMGLTRIGRISKETVDSVLSLKNFHVAEIRRHLGIDGKTIKRILEFYGIKQTKLEKEIKTNIKKLQDTKNSKKDLPLQRYQNICRNLFIMLLR